MDTGKVLARLKKRRLERVIPGQALAKKSKVLREDPKKFPLSDYRYITTGIHQCILIVVSWENIVFTLLYCAIGRKIGDGQWICVDLRHAYVDCYWMSQSAKQVQLNFSLVQHRWYYYADRANSLPGSKHQRYHPNSMYRWHWRISCPIRTRYRFCTVHTKHPCTNGDENSWDGPARQWQRKKRIPDRWKNLFVSRTLDISWMAEHWQPRTAMQMRRSLNSKALYENWNRWIVSDCISSVYL